MVDEIPSDPWRKRVGAPGGMGTSKEPAGDDEVCRPLVLEVVVGAESARFDLRPGTTRLIGRRSSMQTGSDDALPKVEEDETGNLGISGNPHVSSRHARLDVDDKGMVWVTDLGSLNGTYLGSFEHRLPPNESVPLPPNSRLILCRRSHLTFLIREGS